MESRLRSRALTSPGTAGIPPRDALTTAIIQLLDWAAAGLPSIETQTVPSPKSSKLGRALNVPAASSSSQSVLNEAGEIVLEHKVPKQPAPITTQSNDFPVIVAQRTTLQSL